MDFPTIVNPGRENADELRVPKPPRIKRHFLRVPDDFGNLGIPGEHQLEFVRGL